ncbi:Cof-type HAD-IIB family hydrolase [Caldisalinibacter kiritimatiensis]|uniref:Hydrolase (HAD superfamily) n=1 Tax=Caldisalinibacter kiritimatiensis TaxID=1304284 RepID=R1AY50_9FIRM|nr:Cof-type HAD-IIB family hydrolase [Caldisalinibacter kiritimatiensis]EOD01592.1 Hydrolase (HAD superfamily) [Caldisalinibacter kiritimatiensis]
MNYKLIAIDLDGTLLNDDKKITQDNIEILRELNKRGIEIVIATGRRYWSAKQLTKVLGLDLVIIANNGNIIRDITDDKLMVTKYLDEDAFRKLIEIGKSRGFHPIIHVDHYDEGYDIVTEFKKEDDRYCSYLSKIEDRYRVISDLSKYENPKAVVTCYVGEYDELEQFQKEVLAKSPYNYNTHIMRKTKIGSILEFMNPLGSKWLSLKEYAESKGISPDRIIAIGDDNNDIEMIQNAGLGIGMKNGTKEVKKAADIITEKTNNESGVAHILKKIFMNLV